MFYAFFLLDGITAFIIPRATMPIIASERESEYATIKNIGVRDRELSTSIFNKTGLLSTNSVLIGITSTYTLVLLLGKR
jgi:ABC-type antimicrobial peptide transport system permease subunit